MVALASRSFMTVVELRRHMESEDLSIDKEDRLKDALNEASAIIRNFTGRRHLFLADADYVEYHDVYEREMKLWLREKPIISITKIEEDGQRAYGAATELTVDTEYIFDKNRATITRVSGADISRWEPGTRAIKVTYQGGYLDSAGDKANVPADLKRACSKLALTILREEERALQGVRSQSDSTGAVTRFENRVMSEDVIETLRPYRVRGWQTWITDEVVA